MADRAAWTEKQKPAYEIKREDFGALLHTLEHEVSGEIAKKTEKEKIVAMMKWAIKVLNKQLTDAQEHGHVTESEAWKLRNRMVEMINTAKGGLKPETPKPEEPSEGSIWPDGIPEKLQSLYDTEIANAEKAGMDKDVINFVMKNESKVTLTTPDTSTLWNEVGHLRSGKEFYWQGKTKIETPNEALTIDPGFDLGQAREENVRSIFKDILTWAQLARIIDLQKYIDNARKAETSTVVKNLPPEYADLGDMRLSPLQVRIMALRIYRTYWETGKKTVPGLDKAPAWVRAAFASKFVHRGWSWITQNIQDYVESKDTGKKDPYRLQPGLDALKKTPIDWYVPQLVYFFGIGPLKPRATEEQKKYLSWATPEQKAAFETWKNNYENPPKLTDATGILAQNNDTVNDLIAWYRAEWVIPRVEKTAWAAYDLKTNKQILGIHENEPMRAASMIKSFVALAYLVTKGADLTALDKKKVQFIIDYKTKTMDQATLNRLPSGSEYTKANALTTEMIKALGGPSGVMDKLAKILPQKCMEGVNINETIDNDGTTYKNTLTPNALVEFYKYLYEKRTEEPYKTLLNLLVTEKRDSIYDGVPAIPADMDVANKSGTTGLSRGDGGIILAKDKDGTSHPYIFVSMFSRGTPTPVGQPEDTTKYPNYTADTRKRANISREVSGKIYKGLE